MNIKNRNKKADLVGFGLVVVVAVVVGTYLWIQSGPNEKAQAIQGATYGIRFGAVIGGGIIGGGVLVALTVSIPRYLGYPEWTGILVMAIASLVFLHYLAFEHLPDLWIIVAMFDGALAITLIYAIGVAGYQVVSDFDLKGEQ